MEAVPPFPDDLVELGHREAMSAASAEELDRVERPVFLVGCARSGTSIFGEALAVHPRIAYLFEASSIWNELVPKRGDHRLERTDASHDVRDAILGALLEAARGLKGDVLLEKNPKHVLRIPFLDELFPLSRFLHIIRDGRDVVPSLMFRNRGAQWGHLEVPGWHELLARYPLANHIRAAHQWRIAVEMARADARSLGPGRYLEVRYEDLVRAPAEVIGRTLSFLGLPGASDVEAFLPRIQDATRGSYHARKQVRHYIENHSRRIGRFEENLSPGQLDEVIAACRPLLEELGYLQGRA